MKDDGLPNDTVTSSWSTISAPDGGDVLFSDATSPSTPARFTVAGEYVLRLTATDGEPTSTKAVTVQGGLPAGGVGALDVTARGTIPPTTPPTGEPSIGVSGHERLFLGVTQVEPGGQLPVTITGGNPGAVFTLELHSTPVALGMLTIGADGTGTALVTIPAYVETGTHDVRASLNGTVYTAPLVVSAPGASTGSHLLPGTGMDAAGWQAGLVVGIGALVLGAGVLAGMQIRRRARRNG